MKSVRFDSVCDAVWCKVTKYKYEISSAVLLGMLAYMFYFTNTIYNHDSVNKIVISGGYYYTLGRWGTDLLALLCPHPTMPWYDGFMSVLLYTIGICLISSVFELKNKYVKVLLAGIIITFPSIWANYLFMYQAINYSLAFMLATSCVWLWKNGRTMTLRMIAALCVTFLLSLYQGLLAIATSLMLIYMMQMLIGSEKTERQVLSKGLEGLGILAVGVFMYGIVLKTVIFATGNGLGDYAQRAMDDGWSYPQRILWMYKGWLLDMLTFSGKGVVVSLVSSVSHIIAIIACGVLLFGLMRYRSVKRIAFMCSLLCLYPVSINFIYMVASISSAHTLVIVGFLSIYVLWAVIVDRIRQSVRLVDVVKIVMCIVIFCNIRAANVTAMYLRLCNESRISFYTTLITQIESSGLLDEHSKLALIGKADHFVYDYKGYPNIMMLAGVSINVYSRQHYMKYFLGFDVPNASVEEREKIVKTSEFKAMPVYPANGAIRKIGDVIVVRLSEDVYEKYK